MLSSAEYNETVTQELLGMGRCSGVVYKELFLTAEELHGVRHPVAMVGQLLPAVQA